MSIQSKKPDTGMSDFSETFSSLNELFPLNEYKSESDTVSEDRSSTKPKPLQNGRFSHALVGKWGQTTEFKASPISNETFQTVPNSTLFEMMKAGAGKYVGLFMLFQTSYFRHEYKGDEKAETESYWTERDFSGVTWAYTPVTYKRMSELTGVPASTLSKQVGAFAEYKDSNGDPFVQVFHEGKLVKPKDRKQDGNVYVLNGVRLPSDRVVSKKQNQLVVQGVVQSVSHYDTPQTGSTKGESTRVSIDEYPPKVEGGVLQKWIDPVTESGDLVSINKDLSKDLSQLTSELTRSLSSGNSKSIKRTDIHPNQLSKFTDLSVDQQRLILSHFNVDVPQQLTQTQMSRGLAFVWSKDGTSTDVEFQQTAIKTKQNQAEKKRAEAEYQRQQREKETAQRDEADLSAIELDLYGRVLSGQERIDKKEERRKAFSKSLKALIPSNNPVIGDYKH